MNRSRQWRATSRVCADQRAITSRTAREAAVKKLAWLLSCMLMLTCLGACNKQPAAPVQNQNAGQQAGPATSSTTASETVQTPTEAPAAAAPAESVSETDDEPANAEPSPTG